MKTRKILSFALVAAALAAPAAAQNPLDTAAVFGSFLKGNPAQIAVSNATQAGDVAVLIRYSPRSLSLTKPSGTIQTTATTILFKTGLNGAEVADTSLQCGATPGTFDLTQATCDTVGEVVNLINAATGSYWRAVPFASLSTDVMNNKITVKAAATANLKTGYQIVWGTNLTLFFGGVLQPNVPDISPYINDPSNALRPYPDVFQLNRAALSNVNVALTGTTPQFQVYSILPTWGPGPAHAYSEVVTQLFQHQLVSATVTNIPLGGPGILGRKGEKLLLRVTATAAASVPYMFAYGSVFPR